MLVKNFGLILGILLSLSPSESLDVNPSRSPSSINRRQAINTIAASSLLTNGLSSSFPLPAYADDVSIPIPLAPTITLPTPSAVKVPLVKQFPLASFGLQIYDNDTAYKLTLTALKAGYRNFFASVLAGNQKGFAKAIKDSNIPRDELYICGTVLSNRAQSYDDAYKLTTKGCMENLNVMNNNSGGKIEYLDMIMLDYPCKTDDGVKGQWDSFVDFMNNQHVAHLAVSNFSPRQLDICLNRGPEKGTESIIPTVNQLPYSIANHPPGIVEENNKRGVHIQSWSPLSSTLPRYKGVMKEVGDKYGKSAAQVGLRWIVQNGGSYSVQSKKASHFVEDMNVFDFELSQKDMDLLSGLSPPVGF